ncbi:hypothetical protein F3Y22_tig00110299pilonHSYRG00034 [Hibiscus syriacus]|uniref:Uncharacterized protein n=1 Tax=Hibiscus syriacus TaxID=106335 RepID=A0A6A3B5V9_HIBSY|nr:hypothetical protein F3Y22_tig00110299pilonHSYRG00034 [Hibiscus syriacus]
MAISTRCCLNVSPPTPNLGSNNSSLNTKGPQVAWPRDDKWRKQCALGLAFMMVGLQANSLETIVPENLRGHRSSEMGAIGFSQNAPALKWQ